jgi:hypothetical protein
MKKHHVSSAIMKSGVKYQWKIMAYRKLAAKSASRHQQNINVEK